MIIDNVASTPRADLIRRLGSSTFNYWFGYAANSILVIWLLNHARGQRPMSLNLNPWEFAALAVTGLFSWTLSEFLLHRYLYHRWASFLSIGHDLHHRRPRELMGVPWYITAVAVVGLFTALSLFLRPAAVGVVMGFNWLGYIFYCLMHHGAHHWHTRNRWMARMRRHHLIHHAFPEHNWGFTTPLWDHVFGTYLARTPQRHRRPES